MIVEDLSSSTTGAQIKIIAIEQGVSSYEKRLISENGNEQLRFEYPMQVYIQVLASEQGLDSPFTISARFESAQQQVPEPEIVEETKFLSDDPVAPKVDET